MKGVLTFCALFAIYCAARGGVVDLDGSNFDQVIHVLSRGSLYIHQCVPCTVRKWR